MRITKPASVAVQIVGGLLLVLGLIAIAQGQWSPALLVPIGVLLMLAGRNAGWE